MKRPDRYTVAAIAAAGLLAAIVAASTFPNTPLLAVAVSYIATVGSLAHATGAPVWRTVGASALLLAATFALLLKALRHLIDLTLWILGATSAVALTAAKATA
jgi:hypothetical protein